jgi:hypothetical protein
MPFFRVVPSSPNAGTAMGITLCSKSRIKIDRGDLVRAPRAPHSPPLFSNRLLELARLVGTSRPHG